MFENREEAARKLTLKILPKVKDKNALIIALPRGAVVMGKIIADYLFLPFDILIVRKIGAPFNPELAIGALTEKNVVFWNEKIIKELNLSKKELEELRKKKNKEKNELEKIFRKDKKRLNPKGKTVVLIDDGVATGATVMAANKYFKKEKAKKIILATPVISDETFKELKKSFDSIITLKKSSDFYAVGQFYKYFPQVTNKEVVKLLV